MKPHKCPVCNGTAIRSDGEPCVSCDRGIVWEPPVAPPPWPTQPPQWGPIAVTFSGGD